MPVAASPSARRARPTSRCRCRTSRDASHSRRSSGRPTTSPRSRPGTCEELPPRSGEYQHPALAHLERSLFDESPPPPPSLDAAVRFLEGAGRARRARAGRRRAAAADPVRCPPRPDRARRAVGRRVARPARDGARRARGALRGRVARPPRRDADRPRAAPAPALRMGRRRAARAVRVLAQPVFRARALVRRLRRGAVARPRDPHARARRGGGGEAPRGSGARTRRVARGRGSRSRRCASSCARCCARRTGRRPRRQARCRASTSARMGTCSSCSTSSSSAGSTATREETDRRARAVRGAALVGRRGRTRRGARPDARAHTSLRGRVRARPGRGIAAAPLAHLAVPRRRPRAASSARGSSVPTRSRATAISSTPRARAPCGGCISCARPRPTKGRRVSRARSGKRSRPCSTATTSRTRRRGGRSPH